MILRFVFETAEITASEISATPLRDWSPIKIAHTFAFGKRYAIKGIWVSSEFSCSRKMSLFFGRGTASANSVSDGTVPIGVSQSRLETEFGCPLWLVPITTNVPSKSGEILEYETAAQGPE